MIYEERDVRINAGTLIKPVWIWIKKRIPIRLPIRYTDGKFEDKKINE